MAAVLEQLPQPFAAPVFRLELAPRRGTALWLALGLSLGAHLA